MKTMTWAEFKRFVEGEGVTDEMEVKMIDVLYPTNEIQPAVVIQGDQGFCVVDEN